MSSLALSKLGTALRDTWQGKALIATSGSKLGAILVSVLQLPEKGRAAFDHLLGTDLASMPIFSIAGATITSDGFVMCSFRDREEVWHNQALVCDVEDLVKNFRGLADHLKLTDAERKEMFDEVRIWIKTDYRAKSELF